MNKTHWGTTENCTNSKFSIKWKLFFNSFVGIDQFTAWVSISLTFNGCKLWTMPESSRNPSRICWIPVRKHCCHLNKLFFIVSFQRRESSEFYHFEYFRDLKTNVNNDEKLICWLTMTFVNRANELLRPFSIRYKSVDLSFPDGWYMHQSHYCREVYNGQDWLCW